MYNYSNINYDPYYMDRSNNYNGYKDNTGYTVDDRGFLVPFVLGGITGGLLAPAFYRPRPYYQAPCYGPYCNYGPYPYY